MVDPTSGVVVRRRVRRRKPLLNHLLYLVPCGRVSAYAMQVMEVADHEHVILSILSVSFSTSVRATEWILVAGWTGCPPSLTSEVAILVGARTIGTAIGIALGTSF
jgi:hypothetical protein